MTVVKILDGHTSPETAYHVDDYPFGFKLRCKIRYWLEYNPKHGFRFVSQTTNPRKGNIPWNKPKASTYMRLGAVMYLDENDHVKWTGISEYAGMVELSEFLSKYREFMPKEAVDFATDMLKLRAKMIRMQAEKNGQQE